MDPQHPIDISKVSKALKEGTPLVGEVPSNPIITSTLEEIKERSAGTIPTHELSPTGQAVARDFSGTLEDTKRLLEEKNRDELLQKLSMRISEVTKEWKDNESLKSAMVKITDVGEGKDQVERTLREWKEEKVPERLFNLTKRVLTISEFRNVLIEEVSLLQGYLSEASEGVSEGQRDVLGKRFIELATFIQGNTEYQTLTTMILEPIYTFQGSVKQRESYEQKMNTLDQKEKESLGNMRGQLNELLLELKQLLENFCNASLDELLEEWNDFFKKLNKDQEAAECLSSWGEYLHKCLIDKEYIKDVDQVQSDGRSLWEATQKETLEKYRPSMIHLASQLRYYLNRLSRDPLTRRLYENLSSLTNHLFYDSNGNPTIKPELLFDLQKVVPAILRNLRFIRIPDIMIREPGLEFLAKDIVINVGELAPHHLRLIMTSDIPETSSELVQSSIDFEMSKIHAGAENIKFAIDRSGIPPISDTGLADVRIYEDGMRINLKIQPIIGTSEGEKNKQVAAGLQIVNCECNLDHFDLNVHGSGHDWMYYILGPYIRRLVKERIEEAIKNYFLSLDLVTTFSVPEEVQKLSQGQEVSISTQPHSQFQSQAQSQSQSQHA